MVRLPISEALWSTWKRYCDTAGISIGRASLALIDRELLSVLGDLYIFDDWSRLTLFAVVVGAGWGDSIEAQ